MSLMEVLVVLLAVAGVAVPVTFCWVLIALSREDAQETDPYQEGLDTSARISAMAFEAERTMHQIAQEHWSAVGDPPSEGQ